MSGFGRAQFRRIAPDMWGAFRWVRDRDPIQSLGDNLLEQVGDDAAVRDLMTRFCYARDARDPEWVASLFTEDAEVHGPEAGASAAKGRDAIGKSLTAAADPPRVVFNRMTNLLIRRIPESTEAWVTCYYDEPRSTSSIVAVRFGRGLARLDRAEGGWKIADWRATEDFVHYYGDGGAVAGPATTLMEPPQSRFQSRQWAPKRNPPFDGARNTWHELRDDVWAAHHWLLDHEVTEGTPEQKLISLADEAAVREVLSNYAYAHDSLDLAWSGSVFTDDAILINETWVFNGNAEVVGAFRNWNRGREGSFHRFSNPIVRFVPNRAEAWLIAYFHVAAARGSERNSGFGRYFGRLSKAAGRWQISDWRIANDARLSLRPTTDASGEFAR